MRSALHAALSRTHANELGTTRFVDELGLAGEVRVDVAVLNGSFSGYEIKSARDTLRRLPKQVEVYSKILDHATLVVADNHLSHAIDLLPPWWGIITASAAEKAVTLSTLRPAKENPAIDKSYLVTLLWREEALAALTARGLDAGVRSKPNIRLWGRLAESLSVDELRDLVRNQLRIRANWRADAA